MRSPQRHSTNFTFEEFGDMARNSRFTRESDIYGSANMQALSKLRDRANQQSLGNMGHMRKKTNTSFENI